MNSGDLLTSSGSEVIKAFLLYDDAAWASMAKVLLEQVVQQCEESGVSVIPWRADLLSPTGFADAALAEALDAPLMVIALARTGFLPMKLLDWLEVWAGCRTVPDAAMGLITSSNLRVSAPLIRSELEALAHRHGISWLGALEADAEGEIKSESEALTEGLQVREQVVTPVLRNIMSGPAPYRFYGLNE
ncbi:MAG: hypothetical protein RMN51_01060 [Verrucomicrobiota bacterium]|nr:hypothetical protein [Limisphaera sp.]MDW8380688.1 hypothetical protein [Verrucomicrobiota bacterium]